MSCIVTPQTELSQLQPITLADWPKTAPKVWVKRDDLIHPIVSGNKWRKLKYTALSNYQHIVSIGGGYSNHLHALGYLCFRHNVPLVALVRGNYANSITPMLTDLQKWGVKLVYIDKQTYSKRDSKEFIQWVKQTFNNAHYIPEGGSTAEALQGVAEIPVEVQQQCNQPISHFLSPVASGATLAGLIRGRTSPTQHVIGIAVLKGEKYLEQQVSRFIGTNQQHWRIEHSYVHGGYAKNSAALSAFINTFMAQTAIEIEAVYSAKLFFALHQMIMQHELNYTHTVVAVHTGGLQGARKNNR